MIRRKKVIHKASVPYRAIHQRRPRFDKKMDELGRYLLSTAEDTYTRCEAGMLDTAVRDEVARGLASIVRAGYDCVASNLFKLTTDQWMNFIDNSTADWFRRKDYAEWFCVAAANGFQNSRPRERVMVPVAKRKVSKPS